ncbi:MAG: hypothetical protein WBP72_10775, partial [Rhodocyclaceae bacterium]
MTLPRAEPGPSPSASQSSSPRLPGASAAGAPFPDGLAARLAKLGIAGDADLLLHLPLRYEDETRITPI